MADEKGRGVENGEAVTATTVEGGGESLERARREWKASRKKQRTG